MQEEAMLAFSLGKQTRAEIRRAEKEKSRGLGKPKQREKILDVARRANPPKPRDAKKKRER